MVSSGILLTSGGRRLHLGRVLGKGGEGTIYHVEDDNKIAVKIYTDGKGPGRQPKLSAMIADRLNERSPFVAFPIETVSANGAFVGFTMRKAFDARLMHQLCSPGDRKAVFPDANFRFLIRVAANFARAMVNINSLGVVVGDINESGVMVDQKGLITVIDSDSFQYSRGGNVFRCLVGKREYTSPELQNRSLEIVDRTINHDAFGIAVIIFEILFMGRHPFSGIGVDPEISKAIQGGQFAYSERQSRLQMKPPPSAPMLADVPRDVAAAFELAFELPTSASRVRPTAQEWVPLLETMEKGIIGCNANSAHYYSGAAQGCPWCRFEAGTGSILFRAHQQISRSTFDIDTIMSKIDRIFSPGPAPDLIALMPSAQNLSPSSSARSIKRKILGSKLGGVALAVLAVFIMASKMAWGFFALIPAGFLFFGEVLEASTVSRKRTEAETSWKSSIESWSRNAGAGRFDAQKAELLGIAASYRALPTVEREMLQTLEFKKRDLQMQKHLEAYKISLARIIGIGDGRKMTLRSFGIETAWDIKSTSITAVPGFGPKLAKTLIDWRRSIESSFKFEPNQPTDPKEIARVRSDIATRRNVMETALIKGIRDLETIKAEALAKRRDTRPYEAAYIVFKQAQIDAALI